VVVEFLAAVGVAGVAVAFVNDAVVVRAVGGDGGAAGGIGRVLELWPQADPCYGDSFPTGLVSFVSEQRQVALLPAKGTVTRLFSGRENRCR